MCDKNMNSEFICKYSKLTNGLDRSKQFSDEKDNIVKIFKDIKGIAFNDYEILLSTAVF